MHLIMEQQKVKKKLIETVIEVYENITEKFMSWVLKGKIHLVGGGRLVNVLN